MICACVMMMIDVYCRLLIWLTTWQCCVDDWMFRIVSWHNASIFRWKHGSSSFVIRLILTPNLRASFIWSNIYDSSFAFGMQAVRVYWHRKTIRLHLFHFRILKTWSNGIKFKLNSLMWLRTLIQSVWNSKWYQMCIYAIYLPFKNSTSYTANNSWIKITSQRTYFGKQFCYHNDTSHFKQKNCQTKYIKHISLWLMLSATHFVWKSGHSSIITRFFDDVLQWIYII